MASVAEAKSTTFDKLWDYSKPAATEEKFRALLPQFEKPEQIDQKLQILTQIARAQGLQSHFTEAHKTLDQVEKQLSPKTSRAEIRYNLERGRVFNSSKAKENARPYFLKAFTLSIERKEDNLAVDAAHMMAIVETEFAKQMEWNLKALHAAESSQDPEAHDWLGSLYNNIGWTYHDAGKYKEALELFLKAQTFREQKKDASGLRIAKWCVARVYRSLGRIDEALQIQTQLEKEFESIKEADGYVFEELGELYLLKEDKAQAKKYFAKAYQELSKDEFFKNSEAKRLQRMKEQGGL